MDTTPPLTPAQLASAFKAAADAHTDHANQTDHAYIDRQGRLSENDRYWHHVGYVGAREAIRRGLNGIHALTGAAEDAMRGLSLPAGVA